MQRVLPTVAILLAGAAPLTAQVPYGSSVIGVISNVSPGEGLYLADRAGNCIPVTGLVAAGSSNANVNACALDPIDDRIWITSSSTNQVSWVRITGTTVSQYFMHGTVPAVSVAAIVFDDNANPIVAQNSTPGGLYRFGRNAPGAGVFIGAVAGGTPNALAKDFAGNIYAGIFGLGQVHVFLKNPDGTYQAPVLLGSIPTTSISGLAFAPTDGVSPDELWITTFGTVGNQLFRMPLVGGPGVAVANSLAGCSWVDYDRNFNDLLIATQAGTDRFVSVQRSTGVDTLLSNIQGGNAGVPAYNDCNDAPYAVTNVAPMILNGGTGPFNLEIGTTCPPGTLALVGTVFPFVQVLGVALVGVDGHLSVSIPNITLAGPLPPGSLQFITAFFDASSTLHIGSPVSWPAL